VREFHDRVRLRRALIAGASAVVLMMCPVAALAQDEDEEEAATTSDSEDEGTIYVTGSRIANVGMRAPTPVTAVSDTELDALSPSTLISALSQLPQFYGNTNNDVRTGFFGSPGSGNLNLRGLNTGGSGRTLTLLDGRRVVPANGFGSVDINILPQALIQRIETVTGGASAAYGTDAVAGAVNFILNTDYTGWEVSAQAGITGRGDRENIQFSATWGSPLGQNLHLLLSGEYYHADLVGSLTARDWYEGWSLINNPAATTANPYEPRYLRVPNAVSAIADFRRRDPQLHCRPHSRPTPCPARRTRECSRAPHLWRQHFQPNGTLAPFVLGVGQGGPFQAFSAHSIAGGGSGDDTTGNLLALAPEAERANAFAYLKYAATPRPECLPAGPRRDEHGRPARPRRPFRSCCGHRHAHHDLPRERLPARRRPPDHRGGRPHLVPDERGRRPRGHGPRKPPEAGQPHFVRHCRIQLGDSRRAC
jgi:iron complex outermembrane recepter protein